MEIRASITTKDGNLTYSYSTYHILKRVHDGSFIWAYSQYAKYANKEKEEDILYLELDISREIQSSCFNFRFEPDDLLEG